MKGAMALLLVIVVMGGFWLFLSSGNIRPSPTGGITISPTPQQKVCSCESEPANEDCGCEKSWFGLGDLVCGTWKHTGQCDWTCSKGNEKYTSQYGCRYE